MRIRYTFGALLLFVAVALPFFLFKYTTLDGLTWAGTITLAIFLCAIVLWVLNLAADYVVALMMLCGFVLSGEVPFQQAFSAFASGTVWLVICAFVIAIAIESSGLLLRISLLMISIFPKSFLGQTAGLTLTSLLISPLVPSAAGKSAILGPLCKSVSDHMGYKRQSNGAVGIFSAMYLSNGILYPAFLSASFMNYMLLGLFPVEIQKDMTWLSWFLYSTVWFFVVLVICFVFIQIYYRPKNTLATATQEFSTQKVLPKKFSRNEKIVFIVLLIAFSLWMTEKIHGIQTATVALGAAVVLSVTQVVTRESFKTRIPWDLVVFIGAVAGCGQIFKLVGLDQFFAMSLVPVVSPMVEHNFALFVTILVVLTYLIRIIISSQAAALAIFVLLLTPIGISQNINPWIFGFIVYTSGLIFIVKYQNLTYLTTLTLVSDHEHKADLVTHQQNIPLCLCFIASSLLGNLASIPYWRYLGLMP